MTTKKRFTEFPVFGLLLSIFFMMNSEAAAFTYGIPQGSISDHANATTVGSIAWYFSTYGAGNIYILTSSGATYNLNNTITLPTNSVMGAYGTSSMVTLLGTSGMNKKTLLTVGNGSRLQYMTIDGNRYTNTVVNASNSTGTEIKYCTIKNTKNNYVAADGSVYNLLINANNSVDINIHDCSLQNAGANPKLNPTENISKGYGILLWNSVNSIIKNNTIAYTTTCGIDITGSAGVDVIGNSITQTALNRDPSTGTCVGPIADGITGYHNWKSNSEDFYIYNNTISYAGNHGIHVSGRIINIQNNTISSQQLSGIMVDDWRDTIEYSEDVIVRNNKCSNPLSWVWQPGNSNRKIFINHVNNTMTLDYIVNQDSAGNTLVVNSSNYNLPTVFGAHI